MAWVCPYCKRQHNEIASWTVVNGSKVEGFCSDSCLNAYVAEHAVDKSNPSGLKAKKMKGGILCSLLCCPCNFATCLGLEPCLSAGGLGLCFSCRNACAK